MNKKLKKIIEQYFEDHDDYFEAKSAFIEDVNAILTKNDSGDQGVICKNLLSEKLGELADLMCKV